MPYSAAHQVLTGSRLAARTGSSSAAAREIMEIAYGTLESHRKTPCNSSRVMLCWCPFISQVDVPGFPGSATEAPARP